MKPTIIHLVSEREKDNSPPGHMKTLCGLTNGALHTMARNRMVHCFWFPADTSEFLGKTGDGNLVYCKTCAKMLHEIVKVNQILNAIGGE